MSDANPSTIREKVRASVYAHLDASDLNALADQWPGSTKTAASPGANADPSYPDKWINWVIDTRAAEIAASLPANHAARRDLLVFTGPYAQSLSGARLEAHLGPPGDCLVDPAGSGTYEIAEPRPRQAVRFKQMNYATIGQIGDEYYAITDDNLLFFTGVATNSRAKVYLVQFDIGWTVTDPLTTYPPLLLPTLEAYVLAHVFAQHGARIDAARHFARERDRAFAALLGGGAISQVQEAA